MRPIELASRIINMPVGVLGRHRPFYWRNVTERGASSLADAVGGKVVVVTGASSGIGEATAERLGAAGAEVVTVARRRGRLNELAERISASGGVAHVHPCDLTDPGAVEALGEEIVAEHGEVEVLVNNAGRSIRRSIELSYDRPHDFERTIELNYLGAVRMVLALLPGMRERGRGQIVNVSTAGSQVRSPRFSAYIASKAALDAFSDCLQAEVADDGIRISTLHLPLVRTPMIEPTKGWNTVPSISAEQAAGWVERAIVHRPPRIGTPYSEFAGLINSISPASMNAMRAAGYRASRDTRAAGREE